MADIELTAIVETGPSLLRLDALVNLMSRAGRIVGELIERGDALGDAQERLAGSIDSAAQATAGFATRLDLMQARNRLALAGVQATDEQFRALAVAAVELSKTTGESVAGAFDRLTQAVVIGSTRALREYGVNLRRADDATVSQAAALEALTERFGQMTVQVQGAADQAEVIRTRMADLRDIVGLELNEALGRTGVALLEIFTGGAAAADDMASRFQRLEDAVRRVAAFISATVQVIASVVAGIVQILRAPLEVIEAIRAGDITRALREAARITLPGAVGTILAQLRETVMTEAFLREAEIIAGRAIEPGVRARRPAAVPVAAPPARPARRVPRRAPTPEEIALAVGVAGGEAAGAFIFTAEQVFEAEQRLFAERHEALQEAMAKEKQISEQAIADRLAIERQYTDAAAAMQQERIRLAEQEAAEIAAIYGDLEAFSKGIWRSFAEAAGQAFGAIIAGERDVAQVIKRLLHETLKAIAVEAFVKALFNTAEGFAALATVVGAPKAAAHFTAAAAYAAVAAAAGMGAAATAPPRHAAGAAAPGPAAAAGTPAAIGGRVEERGPATVVINISGVVLHREQVEDAVVQALDRADLIRGLRPRFAFRRE